jgi:hypothetical protein
MIGIKERSMDFIAGLTYWRYIEAGSIICARTIE